MAEELKLEEVVLEEEEDEEEEDFYHHNYSPEENYVEPPEELIKERMEWFRDQKLGFMMHWGIYSQLGITESWGVCDEPWTARMNTWQKERKDFKREYFDLNKTFNPIRFNPDEWTQVMADGGFKYMIFTTKHHDGFCMFDTEYTDYKVTGKDCPFHTHKYANVCKELFESGRKRGLAIATYFSKADWSCPDYWEDRLADGYDHGRNPSYKVKKNPEKWKRFVDFTRNQILELMTKFGRIDILWLDAGWVCKANKQDIDLGGIVDEARKYQPWLISADRTVGGPYENYVTPETIIPEKPMRIPWESCITIGRSFAYSYSDQYKSAREILKILVEIVAKGGNLALNIAPQPDGRLPQPVIDILGEFGAWMKANGDAIYGTRVIEPYRSGDFAFTQKNGNVYAIMLVESDDTKLEKQVFIPFPEKMSSVALVDGNKELEFECKEDGILVTLPECEEACEKAPLALAFVMKR